MNAALTLPEVVIRLAEPAEFDFVRASWRRSYATLMPMYAKTWGQTRDEWIALMSEHAIRTGLVFCAVLQSMPDVPLGWCCASPTDTMHYVYVKAAFRRRGIAMQLARGCGLKARGVRMTCRPPKSVRRVADAMGWSWSPLTPSELAPKREPQP